MRRCQTSALPMGRTPYRNGAGSETSELTVPTACSGRTFTPRPRSVALSGKYSEANPIPCRCKTNRGWLIGGGLPCTPDPRHEGANWVIVQLPGCPAWAEMGVPTTDALRSGVPKFDIHDVTSTVTAIRAPRWASRSSPAARHPQVQLSRW